MLVSALAFVAMQAQPSPLAAPPTCTGPEHRQFDFWVGEWTVTPTGMTRVVANSLIEKLYDGCVVRENWMPFSGTPGGSLNNYVSEDKRWHQTWVDSSNSRVEFSGGLSDGKMILLGYWQGVNGPGKDALIRMTYSRNADGSVRQHGEQSTDHGLTWSTNFDFTYHRKAKAAP